MDALKKRTAEFARNDRYETLLESLNATLAGVELPGEAPERPVIFIQGVPRSGTTLLYQLLAHTGAFAYPSNLIARFYRAPGMGVLVQRLAEPLLERGPLDLSSRAGHTQGWWEPHEFSYFWRHHLGLEAHHEPDAPDLSEMILQLGRMEAAACRALLFKNGTLAYSSHVLAQALPTVRFIRLTRDPVDVAASILAMRSRYYGRPEAWWSVRPRDISGVAEACPADQVAFQVRHASAALASVDAVEVSYEALCDDPPGEVARLGSALGFELDVGTLPRKLVGSRTSDRSVWEHRFA